MHINSYIYFKLFKLILTGRSNNISAFVKIGSTGESYTEVDILSFDKTVKTIRREINADNKASKWLLDGQLIVNEVWLYNL